MGHNLDLKGNPPRNTGKSWVKFYPLIFGIPVLALLVILWFLGVFSSAEPVNLDLKVVRVTSSTTFIATDASGAKAKYKFENLSDKDVPRCVRNESQYILQTLLTPGRELKGVKWDKAGSDKEARLISVKIEDRNLGVEMAAGGYVKVVSEGSDLIYDQAQVASEEAKAKKIGVWNPKGCGADGKLQDR